MNLSRNPWILGVGIALIAALLGLGVGLAVAGDDDRVAELESELSQKKDQVDELRARESDLTAREDELVEEQQRLHALEETRQAEEDEAEKVEEKVREEIESNTIAGSGTFLVGKDVKSGTYRNDGTTVDGAFCVAYTSKKPNDLVNGREFSNSQGPGVIRLEDGEYFSTEFCKDWIRE